STSSGSRSPWPCSGRSLPFRALRCPPRRFGWCTPPTIPSTAASASSRTETADGASLRRDAPQLEHRLLALEHGVHRGIAPPGAHLGEAPRPLLLLAEPLHRPLDTRPLLRRELVLRDLQRPQRLLQLRSARAGARQRHLGGQGLECLDLGGSETGVDAQRLGTLGPPAQPRVRFLERSVPAVGGLRQPLDLPDRGGRLTPEEPLVGQKAIEL